MSISSTQRQLVRHSAWTLVQHLATALVGLGTTVLLARMLGPSGQGLYGVIATTAMLGGLCINLGTPASTTYAVSRRHISPRRALSYTCAITLLLGGIGALFIALLSSLYAETLWPHVPAHHLLWAAALIPALLAMQLVAGILQGAQAFLRYNAMALVSPLVTFVSTIVALALGGGTGAALGCLLFGQLCAVAWGAVSIQQLTQHEADAPQTSGTVAPLHWWPYFCSLLGFGFMAALANALAYCSYRIDVFLLNAWLSRDRVGYYSVAASVAERLWMLSGAVNMVLFAQVARSQVNAKTKPLDNPTPMLVRYVLWLVSLAASALYIIAPCVLPLLFGPTYAQAVAPLRALLPGVVVFNVARILSQDLAGRGFVRINVIVGAVCLGINIVGNIVLIPKWGTVGAAWASSLSYSADTVFKLVLYTRLTKTPWATLLLPQSADWVQLKIFIGREKN